MVTMIGLEIDDRNSTTRFVFWIDDTTFTYTYTKQPSLTNYPCEDEYIATTFSICHKIWHKKRFKGAAFATREEVTKTFVNNKSTLTFTKNPAFHKWDKQIDTRYYFITKREVQLKLIKYHEQVANICTTPLKYKYLDKYLFRLWNSISWMK